MEFVRSICDIWYGVNEQYLRLVLVDTISSCSLHFNTDKIAQKQNSDMSFLFRCLKSEITRTVRTSCFTCQSLELETSTPKLTWKLHPALPANNFLLAYRIYTDVWSLSHVSNEKHQVQNLYFYFIGYKNGASLEQVCGSGWLWKSGFPVIRLFLSFLQASVYV